jgi:rod shape-determining protein MreC
MRDLLHRLRGTILFAVLVVATLATMVGDRRAERSGERERTFVAGMVMDVAVPVQKAMAAPADAARDLWSRYLALVGLRSENDRLRQRVSTLEEENLQYREALVSSGRLQRIAEMRSDFEVAMLPSEVVGGDTSAWFRSALLDRGQGHGVRSGMPVVTDRGLVGLVTATSPRASQAMLLTDRQSAVDGLVQRSRAQGIVRGLRGDRLEFEFAVRGSDVRMGDVVITSGLGGVYPKGVRIGVVEEVGEAGDLLQTATLRPAVDFGRLEGVFVMLWRAPTMDLLYPEEGGS